MEGFDAVPVSVAAGQERVAYYQNLKPGRYTFRVSAKNSEGIWNRDGASFRFEVQPTFSQTVSFKILIILITILAISGLLYIHWKKPFHKKPKNGGDEPGAPPLSDFDKGCIIKLKHLMEVDKVYLDENITLQSLAEKISISSHELSRLLNKNLKRKFTDYINYYRIEEAKRILADPRKKDVKLIALAYDVGFKTESVFYKAFKKFSGMTPAQYRENGESCL